MQRVLPLLVLLTGCYHAPQWLEAAPNKPEGEALTPLTCDAAAIHAVRRHPEMTTVQARQRLIEAEAEAVSALNPPELRIRTGYPAAKEASRIGIRFALVPPGLSDAAESMMEARVRIQRAEGAVLAVEVAAIGRLAHLRVRMAEALVAWYANWVALSQQSLELARKRTQAGVATKTALQIAEFEAVDVKSAQTAAQVDAEAAQRRFLRWTGGTAAEGTCASPTLSESPHPNLLAEQARQTESHARAFTEARKGWLWPQFLEVAWDLGIDTDRVLLRVGIPLPIFGTSGSHRVVEATELLGQGQVSAMQRRIKAEIAAAQDGVRLSEARRDAVPEMGDAAPTVLMADALELRRRHLQLERRQLEAMFAVERARIELRRAAGLQ